jgi:hypothetical protein
MMGKEPLLTAVAILTLAIGIPTSLSPAHVLSLLDSTFPVDEGDRIVGIRNWDTEDNRPSMRPLHDFDVWREELTSFDQVAAARSDSVRGDLGQERLQVRRRLIGGRIDPHGPVPCCEISVEIYVDVTISSRISAIPFSRVAVSVRATCPRNVRHIGRRLWSTLRS